MKKLILSLSALMAISTPMWAQGTSLGPLVVDLKTGVITDLGSNPTPSRANLSYTIPYATVRAERNPGCVATPFRARVDVNLKPGAPAGIPEAKRVRMTVEYEGPTQAEPTLPRAWVTHIGDDPQNDGFGGGSGLDGVAEAQVNDQNLAVYSAALGAGLVDRLAYQEMALPKGALSFDIANHYFSWGQPLNEVDTTNGKKLFAFPDSKGDYRMYIGLNRVVRDGSTRIGCGAKRAIIEFVP
ncbi:MAG: hypothetical protein U0Q16_24370 [Bryobacteraceae bacterium]